MNKMKINLRTHSINLFGIICSVFWLLLNISILDTSLHEIIYIGFWLYFIMKYMYTINQIVDKKSNLAKVSLCMQVILFGVIFLFDKIVLKYPYFKMYILPVAIMLIIMEMILFIHLDKYRKEENLDYSEYAMTEQFSKDYLFKCLTSIFNVKKRIENMDDETGKKVKIAIYNAATITVLMIAYAFKFIVDAVNITSEEYYFPTYIIMCYNILMVAFIYFTYMKIELLKSSIKDCIFRTVCGIGAIYFFVFRQYGTINIISLQISVYLITPFLVEAWKTGRQYKIVGNENEKIL